jgi:amidohydrolase
MPDWRRELDAFLDDHAERLVSVRRHLHAHPEPSHEEYQTTRALALWLDEAGIGHRVLPSGRGLIAQGGEAGHGRRVALRADIDALHLHDEKDVPYHSTRDGLMHACGHDAHTAMLLGAAMALDHLDRSGHLPHPVPWRALFQPAEETGEGAAEMVAAGAMDGVASVVALHVDPELPAGQVARRVGVMTACCDEFHVAIHGRGGHAARPHQAIDPIAAAVQFLSAAYLQVPRAADSRDPVVLTFGAIVGGTQANVIPDKAIVRGTLRTLARSLTERIEGRLRAIARGVTEATGTSIDLTFLPGPDAVVNDPGVTAVFSCAAAEVVGATNVHEIPRPSLGGEDFAAYLGHAPGCLLRLGVAAPGSDVWPLLHSPRFDIDERALGIGAKILARGAVLLTLSPG